MWPRYEAVCIIEIRQKFMAKRMFEEFMFVSCAYSDNSGESLPGGCCKPIKAHFCHATVVDDGIIYSRKQTRLTWTTVELFIEKFRKIPNCNNELWIQLAKWNPKQRTDEMIKLLRAVCAVMLAQHTVMICLIGLLINAEVNIFWTRFTFRAFSIFAAIIEVITIKSARSNVVSSRMRCLLIK